MPAIRRPDDHTRAQRERAEQDAEAEAKLETVQRFATRFAEKFGAGFEPPAIRRVYIAEVQRGARPCRVLMG